MRGKNIEKVREYAIAHTKMGVDPLSLTQKEWQQRKGLKKPDLV